MIAVLRINARISYHSTSRSVRPLSDSYCAIVPSRSGKPVEVLAEQRSRRGLERGEPRDVVLGRADRRHVPVEHRERRQIVAEDHVAEPDVAPEQDGLGFDCGPVRATPLERVDEGGNRRAAARPVEVVGPEVELGLVVAFGNAGRGARGRRGASRRPPPRTPRAPARARARRATAATGRGPRPRR